MTVSVSLQKAFVPITRDGLQVSLQKAFVPITRDGLQVSLQKAFVPIYSVSITSTRRRQAMVCAF